MKNGLEGEFSVFVFIHVRMLAALMREAASAKRWWQRESKQRLDLLID
jgi:hypothetical protein